MKSEMLVIPEDTRIFIWRKKLQEKLKYIQVSVCKIAASTEHSITINTHVSHLHERQ